MGGRDAPSACPDCGEEVGHLLLSEGDFFYQPCGCSADELDSLG